MRAKFVGIAVLVIATIVALAPTASAHPTVVVYWEGAHAPGLNTACPEGATTRFVATMRVPKGERIISYGNIVLRLRSGVDKYAEGYRVNRRTVVFDVGAGRFAKLESARYNNSYAYPVELSEGASAKIRIQRGCVFVQA